MKELKHGMQIRRTDDMFSPVITIGTVEGMARHDVKSKYGTMIEVNGEWVVTHDEAEAVNEAIERTKRMMEENVYGWMFAWGNLHAACLTSDYPGKAEEMRKKAEAYANAPVIEDGEKVLIEGRVMITKYMRRNCSDCVHFMEA